MKIGLEKVRILTKLKTIQPGQEQTHFLLTANQNKEYINVNNHIHAILNVDIKIILNSTIMAFQHQTRPTGLHPSSTI